MSAMASQISRLLNYLFNRLFRRGSKKTTKLRHWHLWGESTDDRWFPSHRDSNTKNVYIWLRHHDMSVLTLDVQGRSLTRSILWLLMPWLLASPGHQQPRYWLCNISKSWSYTGKDFNYLWHIIVEEWLKIHVYVSSEKFSTWRVNYFSVGNWGTGWPNGRMAGSCALWLNMHIFINIMIGFTAFGIES